MRVLVVGSGVAAAGFLHHAEKLGLVCVHVSSPSNAPPCSLHSTAVAALRGTQKGLSPLGDELVDGWHEANEFYQNFDGEGVERAQHTTAVFAADKYLRRFSHLPMADAPLQWQATPRLCVQEDAWIIRPATFLKRWQAREDFVVSLASVDQRWRVRFLGNEEQTYDHVVLATGYWASWMKELVVFPQLRAVQGSYLSWSRVELGERSFSLTIDDDNVIYQAAEKVLLLGSTSVKDVSGDFADMDDLRERWSRVAGRVQYQLPALEAATVKTGIRSVTKERAPFICNPKPGLHLIGGLYKNGWVMSWRLGRQLCDSIT